MINNKTKIKINKFISIFFILLLIMGIVSIIYLNTSFKKKVDNINYNIKTDFLIDILPKYIFKIKDILKNTTGNVDNNMTLNIVDKQNKDGTNKYYIVNSILEPKRTDVEFKYIDFNLCFSVKKKICLIFNNKNKQIYFIYPLYYYNNFFLYTNRKEILCRFNYDTILSYTGKNNRFKIYKKLRKDIEQNNILCYIYNIDKGTYKNLLNKSLIDLLK